MIPLIYIVSNAPHSLAFQVFRTVALCLLGAWFIFWAAKEKSFRWRGGGPMPTWLARTSLVSFGLFFLWSAFSLWNK
jgi:hypothetical protein